MATDEERRMTLALVVPEVLGLSLVLLLLGLSLAG